MSDTPSMKITKCLKCGSPVIPECLQLSFECGTMEDCDGNFHHTTTCRDFAEMRKPLDERIHRLEEMIDTLTHVIGLTPIAGNKDALQEALDLARKTLKAKESKP